MSAVDSFGDDRVVNNTMRHKYRVLTDGEKLDMQELKDMGLDFSNKLYDMADQLLGSSPSSLPWELSQAHRAIEEAVMWGVKHLTR